MAMRQREISINRRTFLARGVGTGLVMSLGVGLPGFSRVEAMEEIAESGASRVFAPTIWFELDAAGGVLVNIAEAEMGQHVGTARHSHASSPMNSAPIGARSRSNTSIRIRSGAT
jgi:hypothetical protein